MNDDTRFSVIIPVYNTKEEFLRECFSCILNQDYHNYEVLVIDDGSNNETKDILKEYENYPVVKIIHQENKGIVGARLTGINNASGRYIYFLDSDDLVNDNLLNILNDITISFDYPDMIIHDPQRFTGKLDKNAKNHHFLNEGVVTKDEVLTQTLQLHINSITSKVVKTELFKDMEKHIDLSIVNGEDLQQSTYLTLKSNTFYQTYETLEYYRIHEEHGDYYDVTRLHEINFLIPPYKMVFEDTNEYSIYQPVFKNAAIKAVLYIAFQLCWLNINKEKRDKLLDELNNQQITKTLSNMTAKASIPMEFLFSSLIHKQYTIILLFAYIYKLVI